jgi:hypothetical protein
MSMFNDVLMFGKGVVHFYDEGAAMLKGFCRGTWLVSWFRNSRFFIRVI